MAALEPPHDHPSPAQPSTRPGDPLSPSHLFDLTEISRAPIELILYRTEARVLLKALEKLERVHCLLASTPAPPSPATLQHESKYQPSPWLLKTLSDFPELGSSTIRSASKSCRGANHQKKIRILLSRVMFQKPRFCHT